MPFTEDELRAIREADAEIESIFEAEYFKSRKDHVEMDKMLDSEIVKDRKSRNIEAHQKAYYEANKDEIAARRKAYREAKKRKTAQERQLQTRQKKTFMFSVTESEEMSRWKN